MKLQGVCFAFPPQLHDCYVAKLVDLGRLEMSKHGVWNERSAIIVGASEELGIKMSVRLASLGVSIFIVDTNPDRSANVVEIVKHQGGVAESWRADIANRFQVSALIEKARDRFGHISFFVNLTDLEPKRDLLTLDEWEWRRLVDVNLTGAFYCTQLISRVMVDEGGGVIVHCHDQVTNAENPATAATRAAIPALAAYVDENLRDQGVRVFSLTKQAKENTKEFVERIIECCYQSLVTI